jgi:hypothetical protein
LENTIAPEPETMSSKRQSIGADPPSGEIAILLQALDEGYERKAWHGPNLRGSIRGVQAQAAGWHPRPDRHSIAENVVHAAYWKYAVRRRLTGEKRGSFALKGSNWFTLASPLTESSWKQYLALLDAEHRALRMAVASFPAERLRLIAPNGKVRYVYLILGIAMHDVYHAGQIQLLKRLQIKAK